MGRHAQHNAIDSIFALQHNRNRNRAGSRAPDVVDQFDRSMGRRNRRRPRFLECNHLAAPSNRVLNASLDLLGRQEHIQVAAFDPGTAGDRRHLVAMAAQSKRLDIGGRDSGGDSKRGAEPAAVQRSRHAQHPFARETRRPQHLDRHFIQRVGHNDHDGIRGGRADGFGRLANNASIHVDQIGAAHARPPRAPCGHDDHLRPGNQFQGLAADAARACASDAGCVVEIQRRSRRKPRNNVNQRDLVRDIPHRR